MKKIITLSFITLFSLLYFSCGSNSDNVLHPLINIDVPDSYYFEMMNSDNAKILDGILKIENITEADVSGSYTISNVYDKTFPGLSSLGGKFTGQRKKSDNWLSLNLNPKIADNNIFVNLTVMKYYLMGSWVQSGMTGVSLRGAFNSYKQ